MPQSAGPRPEEAEVPRQDPPNRSTIRGPLPDTGIDEIDTAQKFINALWANRHLQDSGLDEETLFHLQNPLREPAALTPDE